MGHDQQPRRPPLRLLAAPREATYFVRGWPARSSSVWNSDDVMHREACFCLVNGLASPADSAIDRTRPALFSSHSASVVYSTGPGSHFAVGASLRTRRGASM